MSSARLCATGLVASMLTACLVGCGPDEAQKAKWAEQQRVACLDKVCFGDVEPKREHMKDALLKINGHWYLGPKEYFSSGDAAVFYWPSKTPMTGKPDGQPWPNPTIEKPWKDSAWAQEMEYLQSEGLRMQRKTINSKLDEIRFTYTDGRAYRGVYYVATQEKRIRGTEPPVLACTISQPPRSYDSCKAGEYWQADVYADFRFRAKHAPDWPAIHQEIIRVLSLAHKVQP